MYTYVLQDKNGQIRRTDSISAGLDYPAVGPEHSQLMKVGRAKYSAVTDADALEGFKLLSELEGIIPALEPSHAICYAAKLVKQYGPKDSVIINLSGRGDKDVETVAKALGY
jgi:tryptophan synthase beta chain